MYEYYILLIEEFLDLLNANKIYIAAPGRKNTNQIMRKRKNKNVIV